MNAPNMLCLSHMLPTEETVCPRRQLSGLSHPLEGCMIDISIKIIGSGVGSSFTDREGLGRPKPKLVTCAEHFVCCSVVPLILYILVCNYLFVILNSTVPAQYQGPYIAHLCVPITEHNMWHVVGAQ